MEQTTKVIFYYEADQAEIKENVFAYFPEMGECWVPFEGHSICRQEYIKDCVEARKNDYEGVLNSLVSHYGYKLEILNKAKGMTLEEIKTAVDMGKDVYWSNGSYKVIKGKYDYLIQCTSNNNFIGLTWADGTTLNGKEEDFFIKDH